MSHVLGPIHYWLYGKIGNQEKLTSRIAVYAEKGIKANSLKRMMNHWKTDLEENGVFFDSRQSNGKKYLDIRYEPQSVDGVDSVDKNDAAKNIVSIVPIDPEQAS